MFKPLVYIIFIGVFFETAHGMSIVEYNLAHSKLISQLVKSETESAAKNLFDNEYEKIKLANSMDINGVKYRYGGCTCQIQTCLCCASLQVNDVFMDDIACYKLNYTKENNLFNVVLSIKPKLNETIENDFEPSSLQDEENCFDLSANKTVCSRFYGLSVALDNTAFEGCIEMIVKNDNNTLAILRVGCFSMLYSIGHWFNLKDIVSVHDIMGNSAYESEYNPIEFWF